jgi:hypothetical protein
MNATVPVFLTVIQGSDHIYAARDGLPPIVAWLRWHLGGEIQRKSMFIGANCDFCTGKWQSMSKNWGWCKLRARRANRARARRRRKSFRSRRLSSRFRLLGGRYQT